MVLTATPDPSMNRVSGTAEGAPRGAFPARNVATAVPWAPGTVRGDPESAADRLHRNRGSLSTMNARPSTHTRVVRACETWKPLSGSGPS
jgi:hypothetical protein